MKNQVMEIPIDKIKSLDNSRIRIEHKSLALLMEDIKHRGLLQPISVFPEGEEYIIRFGNRRLEACKKLGWETIPAIIVDKEMNFDNYLADNVAENIHREDITPLELARVVGDFKNRGLSIGEIAAVLSIPINRIKACLVLNERVPEEFREDIKFGKGNIPKTGYVSVKTANQIISPRRGLRLDKKTIGEIFKEAKRESLSAADIRIIQHLMKEGFKFQEVKSKLRDIRLYNAELVFNSKEIEKYQENIRDVITKIIVGELPPNSKLLVRKL